MFFAMVISGTTTGRRTTAFTAVLVTIVASKSTAAFAKAPSAAGGSFCYSSSLGGRGTSWRPKGSAITKHSSSCGQRMLPSRFEELRKCHQHTTTSTQLFDLRGGQNGGDDPTYDSWNRQDDRDLDDDNDGLYKEGLDSEVSRSSDRRYREQGNLSPNHYESYYDRERRLPNASSYKKIRPPRSILHDEKRSKHAPSADLVARGGSDRYQDDERYYQSPNDSYERRQDDYYSPQQESSSTTGSSRDDYNEYGGDYRREERGNEDPYYSRDYDYYDDRGSSRSSRNSNNNRVSGVSSILRNGDRRIGMMLLSGGGVLTMLGISLFFNKSLLRMGNLLLVAGVPITIGPGRTMGYFFQPKKSRATACLCAGIILVFIGWPVFGMALEVFGLLNLFGNMFPVVTAVLKQMPIVKTLFGGGGGDGRQRNSRSNRRDYDDDDRYYGDGRYERDGYGDGRFGNGDDADGRGPDRYY